MKSLILSCSFTLIAIPFLFAQTNIPVPTHSVTKHTADPFQPLTNSNETFYYFNNEGKVYEAKSNKWNGGNWVLDYRTYYTYNTEGRLIQILDRAWDESTSTLSDKHRTLIGYHTDGQRNYQSGEVWNAASGTWMPDYVETRTFTATDKILEYTVVYSGGAWGHHATHTYDFADRVSQIIVQSLISSDWKNNRKIDYIYNGVNEDYDEAFSRYWNESDSTWSSILSRDIQTVTNSQRIILSEQLDGTIWSPYWRTTIHYNTNNQELDHYSENWDGLSSAWLLNSKAETSYNNDQSPSTDKFSFVDQATGQFFLAFQNDYDYNTYPLSTQLLAIQNSVIISPNPTADLVRVELEGKAISNITLLDLRGNVLARTTASRMAQFSLANQPVGTYFLRVEQGGVTKVLPVVKN